MLDIETWIEKLPIVTLFKRLTSIWVAIVCHPFLLRALADVLKELLLFAWSTKVLHLIDTLATIDCGVFLIIEQLFLFLIRMVYIALFRTLLIGRSLLENELTAVFPGLWASGIRHSLTKHFAPLLQRLLKSRFRSCVNFRVAHLTTEFDCVGCWRVQMRVRTLVSNFPSVYAPVTHVDFNVSLLQSYYFLFQR